MKGPDQLSDDQELEPTELIVEDVEALLKQRYADGLDIPEFPDLEENKADRSPFYSS